MNRRTLLAGRIGLPATVGVLLAGVLLGPSLLGRFVPGVAAWLVPTDPAQMHLVVLTGTHVECAARLAPRSPSASAGC